MLALVFSKQRLWRSELDKHHRDPVWTRSWKDGSVGPDIQSPSSVTEDCTIEVFYNTWRCIWTPFPRPLPSRSCFCTSKSKCDFHGHLLFPRPNRFHGVKFTVFTVFTAFTFFTVFTFLYVTTTMSWTHNRSWSWPPPLFDNWYSCMIWLYWTSNVCEFKFAPFFSHQQDGSQLPWNRYNPAVWAYKYMIYYYIYIYIFVTWPTGNGTMYCWQKRPVILRLSQAVDWFFQSNVLTKNQNTWVLKKNI